MANGKPNAVVSLNDVSALMEGIERALKVKGIHIKQCTELRTLREKCCDRNMCTSVTALQGVTSLVKKRVLVSSQTVSLLVSLLPSIIYYDPLVTAVGDILLFDLEEAIHGSGKHECTYNFTDRPHPFVIILKHNIAKSWDAVYCFIQVLLQKSESIKYKFKLSFLRTVFLYIFCDPTPNSCSYKNRLFALFLSHLDKPEMRQVAVRVLSWQSMDMNYCWLIKETFQEILKNQTNENVEILDALTPYLASTVKWLILNGRDPTLWIDLLRNSLNVSKSGSNVVLYILSDVIQETPFVFINSLVDICTSIIYSLNCNKYVAHKFAAVTMIWLANPSPSSSPVLERFESVIQFLSVRRSSDDSEWHNGGTDLCENPFFKIVRNSNDEVRHAFEVTTMSDSWSGEEEKGARRWLRELAESNSQRMQTSLHNFLSGMFLCLNDDEAQAICLDLLLKVACGDTERSFFQLCLIFYKLGRETEPRRHLMYLHSLTKLANSKETIPLIIGIIETLKNDNNKPSMLPVAIDLYLKLWRVDNRTYPYLHKTLFSTGSHGDESWEVNVMKTIALREICRLYPETYGKNLVKKLSDILNDCDSYDSGLPSAMAIEAVIELCKASVTDISGTWKALKPKLSRDQRVEVIVSLCKLFGEIPDLQPSGTLEWDAAMADVIPMLWSHAMSDDVNVIRAALAALSKYNPESYGPSLLPQSLRTCIEIPKQLSRARDEVAREEIIQAMQYLPGECWIAFLDKVDERAVKDTGDALIVLIDSELQTLPRRLFCLPENTLEPSNYSHLPHSSVLRALVHHVKKYVDSPVTRDTFSNGTITEVLRVLSSDYSKALPLLDWSFMEKFFELNDTWRRYAVTILTRQYGTSTSGRAILEKYMKDYSERFKETSDFIFLYPSLPLLCNAVMAGALNPFITETIKVACLSSLKTGANHFDRISKYVRETMESKTVPMPKKALLGVTVQNVLKHIPPDHEMIDTYAEMAVTLPANILESIVSPKLWPKITCDKLRRSIRIKLAMALRNESPNPLSCFNECIDAVAHLPKEQRLLLRLIVLFLRKKRDLCHATWLTELMRKTQASTSNVTTDDTVTMTLFLLDLFMASVITITGYDCFIHDLNVVAVNLFPISLFQLLCLDDYSSLSPQIIEWVHSLSKWTNLSRPCAQTLEECILMLRTNRYCTEKNKWLNFFHMSIINDLTL